MVRYCPVAEKAAPGRRWTAAGGADVGAVVAAGSYTQGRNRLGPADAVPWEAAQDLWRRLRKSATADENA